MKELVSQIASLSIVIFAVASMLSVGLAHRVRAILAPLRNVRAVFGALVANFVLVPLLAVGIERAIPLDAPEALGLFLLAGSAGAPFLIKLASAARGDVALSASLLILLVPVTVIFLPFYVPLATEHPALAGLTYVPSSVYAIGLPLFSTLIAPLALGLALREIAPRVAAGLVSVGSKVASVALVVAMASILAANFVGVVHMLVTGALFAAVLMVCGAFLIGFLLSRRDGSAVLGLGTAQRNIAAAMVIASRDFTDPTILLMITASVLAGLCVLFPIAWLVGRRTPRESLASGTAAS